MKPCDDDDYTNHILYPLLPALSIHILLTFPFLLLPSLSRYTLIIYPLCHQHHRSEQVAGGGAGTPFSFLSPILDYYDSDDDDGDDDEYTNLCLSAPCSFDSYTPHIPAPSCSFLPYLAIPLL